MFQKAVVKSVQIHSTFDRFKTFSTDQSNLWRTRKKAYWCKTVWTF